MEINKILDKSVKKNVLISIDTKAFNRTKEICSENNITFSQIITNLLTDFIINYDNKKIEKTGNNRGS